MRFRFTLSNDTLGTDVLARDPRGWDAGVIKIMRSPKYHGITFERSVALDFLCSAGKEYVDTAYDTWGPDAKVTITIDVACNCSDEGNVQGSYSDDYSDDYDVMGIGGEGDCDFEEFFVGELDYREYSKEKNFTTVRIIEAGPAQQILSKLDTKVDLMKLETLDGTALTPFTYGPYDLTMHGKAIVLQGELDVFNYTETVNQDAIDNIYIEPPFDVETRNDIVYAYPTTTPHLNIEATKADTEFIFRNDGSEDMDIELGIDIVGTMTIPLPDTGLGSVSIQYIIKRGNGFNTATNIFTNFESFTTSGNIVVDVNESFSGTITLAPSEAIWVYFRMINYERTADVQVITDFSICKSTFINTSIRPDTEAKAFAIYEAGARIAQSIVNDLDPFRSSYFGRIGAEPHAELADGCGSKRAITSGTMIRQFPTTGDNAKSIFMSMAEYFDTVDAIDDCGLGIEKEGADYKVRIDRKSYFYDKISASLFQMSNVPDIKYSIAIDRFNNNIELGYETWEAEEVNGIDEFNTVHQYSPGFRTVTGDVTKKSPSIGSGYAIEFTRRKKFVDTSTEDWKFDNNNFILALNQSDLTLCEKDENFTVVNNLISPETSYNLRLSPARNFLRHSPTLNPALLKFAGRETKFTYGEGNYAMSSEMDGDTCPGRYNNNLLSEGQNIQWDAADNSDNDPLWIPEFAEFEFPISQAEFNLIRANPYKTIEFSEGTSDYIKGFIIDAEYNPFGGLTKFKLLKAYVS